ncbi:hypothetical protein K9U40_03370 [Xanthobacter autotrophicus]|uniref:hypothetical protein n=1 Tax=Xanthobacter TaxID=279 RepID=UPI0024AA3783|nr:hypothetical protein [Xanthobacter autotrophicus]MDI4663383.1 hypothetical protein [Xanthobacter autotrophicus]
MKRSSIITMVGATLLGVSLLGGDLVRAFPAMGPDAPSATAATSGAPYRWQGYWSTGNAVAAGNGSLCPFRKTLSLSGGAPRLKWQRACQTPV